MYKEYMRPFKCSAHPSDFLVGKENLVNVYQCTFSAWTLLGTKLTYWPLLTLAPWTVSLCLHFLDCYWDDRIRYLLYLSHMTRESTTKNIIKLPLKLDGNGFYLCQKLLCNLGPISADNDRDIKDAVSTGLLARGHLISPPVYLVSHSSGHLS